MSVQVNKFRSYLSELSSIISVKHWLQHLQDPSSIQPFLREFSTSIEDIHRDWSTTPAKSFSLAAFEPLLKRPFVRLNKDQIIAPLPSLICNALGEGFYHGLLDMYDKTDRDKLARCFGVFLEEYVRRVFRSAYLNIPHCCVLGDEAYGKRNSKRATDVVVFEGDDVIFIEVVARRVNLGAILDFNESSIEEVFYNGIERKLKQLHLNIESYIAGELYPKRTRPSHQRIFAMIATSVPYPTVYAVNEYIPEIVASNDWLHNVESIEMISVDDIELLEDSMPRGFRLADFLISRKSEPDKRPLNNSLLANPRIGNGRPSLLRGNAFIQKIAEELHS